MKQKILQLRKNNPVLFPLTIFFLFIVVAIIVDKNASLIKQTGIGKIGVLPIDGIILTADDLINKLEAFEEDEEISGLILRINSPGGAVAPVQEVFEKLLAIREKMPIYTSVASLAASGGYYLATASDKIFANNGSTVGSIGVIFQYIRYQKLFEKVGLEPVVIKSGKYKDILSPYRDIEPEERAAIQTLVDSAYQQFVADIAKGRSVAKEKIFPFADGSVFTGSQAKENKLIDEIGSFNTTIEELRKKLNIKKVELVYPKEGWRNFLQGLDVFSNISSSLNLTSGLFVIYSL